MEFKSIFDFIKTVPDEASCVQYLEEIRWAGVVVSPFDETSKVYKCKNGYKCKNTGKYFNVKVGTIFEDTKIPLTKWFMALYIFASHKKGCSSYQLARDISITQKSAWFMLHRLRYMFDHPVFKQMMGGTVEVDETYMGGKTKNKHAKKYSEPKGRGVDKAPVVAIVQRNGNVRAFATQNVTGSTLYNVITQSVERGSTLITDAYNVYNWVGRQYNHISVKHNDDFVTFGDKHTNSVEGFFSHLKRLIIGTYHSTSRKHLQSYCDELSYRFSTRKLTTNRRFDLALENMVGRLTYKTLIA